MHTALHWKSKIADLYTITLTPRRRFYTLQWSDIQYFLLLLHPADNKRTKGNVAPHMNRWLQLVSDIAFRHLQLSASQWSRQQNYRGRHAATSETIDRCPTRLFRNNKRPDPWTLKLFWETRADIALCRKRNQPEELRQTNTPNNNCEFYGKCVCVQYLATTSPLSNVLFNKKHFLTLKMISVLHKRWT